MTILLHEPVKIVGATPIAEARPKALFCIFQAGAEADGGVTSITEIVLALAGTLDIEILTNRQSEFNRRWLAAGCRVKVLPMGEADFTGVAGNRFIRRSMARVANNLRVWRHVLAERPAFIHCNDQQWFWSVILAAKTLRVPVVLNVRDALPPRYETAPARWKAAFSLTDRFLVLSADMAAYWGRMLGAPRNSEKLAWRYSIVRGDYGAPTALERTEIRRSLDLAQDAFVVSYVASFNPKKRQAEYIEKTVASLIERLPEAVFVFVGDIDAENNPAAARAVKAAAALPRDRVVFAGFAATPALWYKASDLVVLASEREGLPRCLIEALCCGTPFVSFDVSSAHELAALDKVSAVLAQGDHDGLANAIIDKHDARVEDAKGRSERAERAIRLFDQEAGRKGYLEVVEGYLGGAK